MSSRPKSVLGLVLLGFSLVAIPPIVAAVRAVTYVNELSSRSEDLVVKGLRLTAEGELLGEQLTAMERNARQYQVLGDGSLLPLYDDKQERFMSSLRVLEALNEDSSVAQRLARMKSDSQVIAVALTQHSPQSPQMEEALQMFPGLNDLSSQITVQSRSFINKQLEGLREAARNARHSLAWQATALIAGTVILVVFFTRLIVKPVRQTAVAIRQLGEGGFDQPVTVNGPPELASLGRELDWLRRRLNALEQEKNKFLRHMSHELKTPLASIREGTELLMDGSVGELTNTQQEVASILKNNSLQLQNLIENLLNFSARTTAENRINPTRFKISKVVNDLRNNHQLSLVGKRLKLEARGKDYEVYADEDQIRTALDNLLSNAIKFSPEGGVIKLLVRNSNTDIVIEVSDEGSGVAEEDREFIFEPFYQGQESGDSHVRGTGLGLSVARDCLQAHGGKIELVESENGGCFRISVPKHER
ncbi:MAG: HAMP domain-containing histidine kinase [Gammaproteobacteria bacterium]|nr:HAMP domain-containing histidine kinase [Gammaproteobacteria bacterium]